MIISNRPRVTVLAIAFALSIALPAVSHAQQATDPNSVVPNEEQQARDQQQKQATMEQGNAPAPKADPKEEAAYKTFYEANPQNPDQKIQLGNDFLQQYPNSRYAQSVYVGLTQAYYLKQDWSNLYQVADKGLAIDPDDVDILTLVGWVIPHVTNGGTPDADKQLAKAEDYEKRAIKDIPTLPKPPGMTDEQFTTIKDEKMSEAHSGLGLVYFRRQDFDDAARELQLATQNNPNPDATDFFALGASFQNSGHYQEAADAFARCGQIMGSLQSTCKDNAEKAKQLAAQNPPKK